MASNLKLYNSSGTAEVTSFEFTDVSPGEPSSANAYRLFNDDSGGSVDNAPSPALILRQLNADNEAVRSGLSAIDERWVEIRALDTGTSEQQETAWTPVGRGRVLLLDEIDSGEYTDIEVRYNPPAGGDDGENEFTLDWEPNWVRSAVDLAHTESSRDGVLSGLGDSTFTELQRGGTVSESSGSADDNINLDATVWVYEGRRYCTQGATQLDGNDGSSAALSSGEYYWAAITLGASNNITVTKGDKASTPVDEADRPSAPTGEILIAWVSREFDGVIEDGTDIEMVGDVGAFAWSVTGITATVGPGWARVDNGLIRRTAPTVVSLTDDDDNYIWLHPDGSITSTTSLSEPTDRAILLYHATAASGAVTQLRDRRGWIGGETVEARFEWADDTDAEVRYWHNPWRRTISLRVEDMAQLIAFGAPSGNTTGEIAIDLEYREPGGSWTSFVDSADRPGITIDDDEDESSFPNVMEIPAEADLRATLNSVSSYDGTAPTDIHLTLSMEAV